MDKNILELVIFEIREDVSDEQFIHLFQKLNTVLKRNINGFVKRSLTKDMTQNKWVEMIWWESMHKAHLALEKLPQFTEFKQYCSVIKDDSTLMYYLEQRQ
ncbi:hypothetical protein [uncultured Tyzzerella sp.]|uniref:hypothetical protein n=1 Tax=uncultured Tyzzerella sp. TaxID=2321398 RepID=UPI00294203F1|nr:hypothetical protein [uncultured Tyzzerella sp.]